MSEDVKEEEKKKKRGGRGGMKRETFKEREIRK